MHTDELVEHAHLVWSGRQWLLHEPEFPIALTLSLHEARGRETASELQLGSAG